MATTSQARAMVQSFEVRKTRKGESFATLRLSLGRDLQYGSMDAKIWQFDQFIQTGRPLPAQGDVLEVKYTVDEYRGMPQWTIQDFDILDGDAREAALEQFIPPPRIDKEFYQNKLDELIDQTDPERVTALVLRTVFDRAEFREEFCKAPAAFMHHQSYTGGLLEHTLNVTCLALALADSYGAGKLSFNGEHLAVDRTLLISSGLLHDIGKLETYRLAPVSQTTDSNRFEGHLAISYAIVRDLALPHKENPPYEGATDEVDKLLNCILAHHGMLEYGSPVTPVCIEAFLLAHADVADARLASIVTEGNSLLRQSPGARWLRHVHFPTGMFLGDWPPPPPI